MWRYLTYQIDRVTSKSLSILNLGVIGVIIGLLSVDSIKFMYKGIILYTILITFIVLLLIILLAKATIKFIWLRASNTMPKGELVDYKCQFIEESNGLFTQVKYILINKSINAQRTILYDFEGINNDVALSPIYIATNRSHHDENGEIRVCGYDEKIPLQEFKDYANPQEKIHQADWSVMLDPPLEPNETITFNRLSNDADIYKESIDGEETDFSFRPRMPFKKLGITIIPPPGFIISEYESIIDDQKGTKIQHLSFLEKRLIKVIGGNLVWEVPFPRTTLRYKLKFSLKKII